MRKELLFIPLIILLSSSASAELLISPEDISLTAEIGRITKFNLTLINSFNHSIVNVTLNSPTSEILMEKINTLFPGDTITKEILVAPTFDRQEDIQLVIEFSYYVNITSQPEQHLTDLSRIAFLPQQLTIRKGDNIRWFNTDNITHTIHSQPEFGLTQIPPSGNFVHTFNNINSFTIINVLGFTQSVDVLTNIQTFLTSDPTQYKTINLHLDAKFSDTSINMILLSSPNLTISHGDFAEGVVRIDNGNNRAINVLLFGDWFNSFSKNNFTIEPNSNTFVTFRIFPTLSGTSDTNKTYTKSLTLSGKNFNSVNTDFTIFIPFKEITDDPANLTREEQIKRIEELLAIIRGLNLTRTEVQTIFLPANISANFSLSDLLNFNEDVQRLLQDFSNFANRVPSQIDYESLQQDVNNTKTGILALTEENRDFKTRMTLLVLIGLTIIVMVAVFLVFWNVKQKLGADSGLEY